MMSTYRITILLFVNLILLSPLQVYSRGLSFANCNTTADCVGRRSCVAARSFLTDPCTTNTEYCVCSPGLFSLICRSDSDCDTGETCFDLRSVSVPGVSAPRVKVCLDNKQLPFASQPRLCVQDSDCPVNGTCVTFNGIRACGYKLSAMSS